MSSPKEYLCALLWVSEMQKMCCNFNHCLLASHLWISREDLEAWVTPTMSSQKYTPQGACCLKPPESSWFKGYNTLWKEKMIEGLEKLDAFNSGFLFLVCACKQRCRVCPALPHFRSAVSHSCAIYLIMLQTWIGMCVCPSSHRHSSTLLFPLWKSHNFCSLHYALV